jgi:hypothetical protein
MKDPIGVLKFPVSVTPVSGLAEVRLKERLDLMERELAHVHTAIKDIRNGLRQGDTRLLTSGVMNSRNWTLSIVVSHCFIQTLLGSNAPGSSGFPGQATPLPGYQAETLFARAGREGHAQGLRARA